MFWIFCGVWLSGCFWFLVVRVGGFAHVGYVSLFVLTVCGVSCLGCCLLFCVLGKLLIACCLWLVVFALILLLWCIGLFLALISWCFGLSGRFCCGGYGVDSVVVSYLCFLMFVFCCCYCCYAGCFLVFLI